MEARHLLQFKLDGQNFAFSLEAVKRISMVTEYSVAYGDSDCLLGHITFEEESLPLLNLRSALSLKQRPIQLEDQLIILTANGFQFAVTVDSVSGVEIVETYFAPGAEQSQLLSACIHNDDVIMILNVEKIRDAAAKPMQTVDS